MNRRQSEILNHLASHGQASVQELAELLGVSMVTMRQDLTHLENENLLKRTHGGATLLEPENLGQRLGIRFEQKRRIVEKAASLVADGETVLLESGSATALLARKLAGRNVQILVTNLFIARQIKPGDLAKVVVLGGLYQPDSESVVGAMARQNIRNTNFTKAFLGVDGFTPETGFTNRDMERAEIAALIVERCRNSYVLADSSKFGATAMAHVCAAGDLAGVITNKDVSDKHAKAIRKSGAALYLA